MRAAYATSKQSDAAQAVNEVVEQCRGKLSGEKIAAGLVFWGGNYDAGAVAQALGDALGDVPHIGCSTDGEISSRGLSVDSVCLFLLASDQTTARATCVDLQQGSEEAGRAIAGALGDENARALILLPDGLKGNGSALIRGAQQVLGSDFVIAGGTAGDRGRFEQTHQLCNGKAHTGMMPGLMLYNASRSLEVGFGVMSGWQPIGIAKTVTKAEGNVVFRIGEETALEVYSKFLGDKASQLPAIGVEYPFGLVDDSGRVGESGLSADKEYILLRAPMAVDRDRGSVTFAAEIPEQARIKMTMAKLSEVIAAARVAAERAAKRLSGKPDAVLFFSCMARKIVLGRRTGEEIQSAQAVFGDDVPMAGFYTYGEIANCGDESPRCRFHNETATFLALREAKA